MSLPFDCSISVWHGKFTAVYGQVFYSDLNTRNGSLHNGCVPSRRPAPLRRSPSHTSLPAPPTHPPPLLRSVSVAKDQPILLADGDELCLGDVRLRVGLERAAAEEELQENGGGR